MSAAPTPAPAPETASPNPAPSGRDPHGRFARGNRGGPGNPFARRVAALRSAPLDSILAADLAAIVRAFIAKATAGDVAAAKLVFAYVLGKPAETVDPDRLDVEEWQHFKDTTGMFAEMPHVGQAPHPQLPLEMVRFSRPIMTELCGRQMKELLQPPPAESACQETSDADNSPSPNGEIGPVALPQPSVNDPGEAAVLPSILGLDEFAATLDPALRDLWQALLGPSPNGPEAARPAAQRATAPSPFA